MSFFYVVDEFTLNWNKVDCDFWNYLFRYRSSGDFNNGEIKYISVDKAKVQIEDETLTKAQQSDGVFGRDFIGLMLPSADWSLNYSKFQNWLIKHPLLSYLCYDLPTLGYNAVIIEIGSSVFTNDEYLDTCRLIANDIGWSFDELVMPYIGLTRPFPLPYKSLILVGSTNKNVNQLSGLDVGAITDADLQTKPEYSVTETNVASAVLDITILCNIVRDVLKLDINKRVLLKNDALLSKQLVSSIAVASLKQQLSKQDTITLLNLFLSGSGVFATKLSDHFDKEINCFTDDSQAMWDVPDLMVFLAKLKDTVNTKKNLSMAQYLLSKIREDMPAYKPVADCKLNDVVVLINKHLPPALMRNSGSDKDNMYMYNPASGIWVHDENVFKSLITAIRPTTNNNQMEIILQTLASSARIQNNFFESYGGSQYLLFQNGALDLKTNILHSLDEKIIKEQYFTQRMQLSVNWVENPALPVIKDAKTDGGGDWNPSDFIKAYGNNESDRIQVLLFLLSLGLFGGHNSSVIVDIQGESRWWATSLKTIFGALYEERIFSLHYPSLNSQFPLKRFKSNISLIWIDEANEGTEPLNDENGMIHYNALADDVARFEVKANEDILIKNTPQVIVEGTKFVSAKKGDVGPLGRTFPFKLPALSAKLRKQAYAMDINTLLRREDVLEWLVYKMVKAYEYFINENRRPNLKINLEPANDMGIFPDFVGKWWKELQAKSDGFMTWFDTAIEPFLDMENATLLNNKILYSLYNENYSQEYSNDTKRKKTFAQFDRDILKCFAEKEWTVTPVGSLSNARAKFARKQVSKKESMNFAWGDYEAQFTIPKILNLPKGENPYFGKKIPGWYEVKK